MSDKNDAPAPKRARIGGKAAKIYEILKAHPQGCTRMDLARIGGAGLALNAPQRIQTLRRAGIPITTVEESGIDAEGKVIRFGRYVYLAGAADDRG